MKNGVPFHLAFGHTERLDPVELEALTIMFQEMDGATFNWKSMQFEKQT